MVALLLHFFPPGHHPIYPPCVFHQLTGLNCPGCGATRAVYHLMHGEWGMALRHNALFVVALPLIALWLVRSIRPWVRGERLGSPGFTGRGVILAMVILMSFGVVRNLPFAACRNLSPPAATVTP